MRFELRKNIFVKVTRSLFLLSFRCLFSRRLGLDASEEVEVGVVFTDLGNDVLLVEIFDQSTSNGTVDFKLIAKDSSSNAENVGDFSQDLFVLCRFQEDSVVKLLLNLDLGP